MTESGYLVLSRKDNGASLSGLASIKVINWLKRLTPVVRLGIVINVIITQRYHSSPM